MDNNTIDNCDINIIDDNNQLLLLIHINRDNIQPLQNLPSIRPDTDDNIIRQIRNQSANTNEDDDRYANAIIRYGGILEFSGQFDQDIVQQFDQNTLANVVVFKRKDYKERIEPRHLRKLQLLMECTAKKCWPIIHLSKYGKYLDTLTTCDCACLCHLITRYEFTKRELLALEEIGILTQHNIQLMYGHQWVSNHDIQILRNLAELYVNCDTNVFNVAKRIFEHIYDHKLSDEIPLLGNAINLYVYSGLIAATRLIIQISVSIHENRDDIFTKLFEGMRMFINMLEERNENANANQFINLATEAFRQHHFYYNTAEYDISHFLIYNPHSSKLAFVGYYMRMLRSFMQLDPNIQIICSPFGQIFPQPQNGNRRQNFILRYIAPYQCYNKVLTVQQLKEQHNLGTIQDILANLANNVISLPEFNRDQCVQWINDENDTWNRFIQTHRGNNQANFQAFYAPIEGRIILCRLKIIMYDILDYICRQQGRRQ